MSSFLLFAVNNTSFALPFHRQILKSLFPSSLLYSTLRHYNHGPRFSSAPKVTPPSPKKVPFEVTAHGRSWTDPYHWMSNIRDPDFVAYLNEENAYAQSFMADTHRLQKELFSEMSRRLPAKISTAPERWGPWLYYEYIPKGEEYPVLCRRIGSHKQGWANALLGFMKGGGRREEILLDWNEIAKEYGYVHVGNCRVSPDHNFLAYTLDTTGSERFILKVKDLRNGRIIPQVSADGVFSLAWAQDSSSLFYTECDKNQRPYRVLCVELGSHKKTVIFTEDDPSFCLDITCTKDNKYITVNSNSRTSSEVYVLDSAKPFSGLKIVHERMPGVRYFLEHHYGFFYVLTNRPLDGVGMLSDGTFYLAKCRVEDATSLDLQCIFLPGEGTSLQDMDIFNEHLVLSLEINGCSNICSISLPVETNGKDVMEVKDLNPWFFPVPSDLCQINPGSNHDFMTSSYRVVFSSPVMPDIVVEYNLVEKTYSVIHQEEVLGVSSDVQSGRAVNKWRDLSATYSCERHEVISHDGVRIPLTVVCLRSLMDKGRSPGLLHVYGAYGEELDRSWCSDRLSLLDRGWVVAFADVRGGGNPSWHQSGSGANKINSIRDLISCGKYLIDEGYVKNDRLACIGESAGSLVVGAAINFNPKLFHAAILKVPFLDICNTLMDPNLPLTLLDYEEFGNPEIQSEFENIVKYSPYDNVVEGSCYPAMLITTAFHDSRVGVWEAAKWVAKVRENTCKDCSRSVILKAEMTGGHFGEGGRFGQCDGKAYEYAFLMKTMEMSDDQSSDDTSRP